MVSRMGRVTVEGWKHISSFDQEAEAHAGSPDSGFFA